jgi:hypothetical protein
VKNARRTITNADTAGSESDSNAATRTVAA